MKPFTISVFMLLAVTLVLAGVLVAGCTQDNGSTASPANTGSSPSSGNGGSYGGSYSGNHSFSGQGFLNNETMLNAAAAQLGVSEQALQNALTPQNGQWINFTDAANQLGVTPAQLRAALGFPAGGFHGNRTMSMMTPASGQ